MVSEIDTAARLFREAIRIKPDFAEAYNNLGAMLDANGQLTEAIGAFREAIKIKPDFGLAHANLGLALKRSGAAQEAIATLREAVRINPDSAAAYNALGVVLSQQDDLSPAEGIAALRRSIKLDPDVAEAHHNLGVALYQSGALRKALRPLRKAIKLDPDLAAAHFLLGNLRRQVGQPLLAIDSYREVLRTEPDDGAALCGIGMALGEAGEIGEAIATFGYALDHRPEDEHAEIVKCALDTFRYYYPDSDFSANHDNSKPVVKSITPNYTGNMGDMPEAAEAFAAKNGFKTVGELQEFIDNWKAAGAEVTPRETTTRAEEPPRPKWQTDRRLDENPATFAWRAYQVEAKAGTLHRGVIYSEDRELHRRLNSWLRSHPMPEGIDIPTLPEWNSRQLAKLADDPAAQEVRRLIRAQDRQRQRRQRVGAHSS